MIPRHSAAGRTTDSVSGNCVTPTSLADKVYYAELVTSLDPAYPVVMNLYEVICSSKFDTHPIHKSKAVTGVSKQICCRRVNRSVSATDLLHLQQIMVITVLCLKLLHVVIETIAY